MLHNQKNMFIFNFFSVSWEVIDRYDQKNDQTILVYLNVSTGANTISN